MQESLKKILISFLIIFILSIFLFLGINYLASPLAFISGVITAWVTINPLEVNVSAPAEVEIDKVFKVEAKVINKGEEKIENARAEIFLPSGLVLLKKDPMKKIGVILAKKEKKISWSVRGEEIGNYIISVKVSGELKGEELSKEGSTMVRITEKTSPGREGGIRLFERFFNLFQGWFR